MSAASESLPARGGEDDVPRGEVVLYVADDGRTRVECRFQDETLWLSQALMAELFQTSPQNITLHLKALYEEGEIDEQATCKEYLQVRREGARQVRRSVKHYNLDAISPSATASAPCVGRRPPRRPPSRADPHPPDRRPIMHPRIRVPLLPLLLLALAGCAATQQPPAVLAGPGGAHASAADSVSAQRAAEGFLAAFDSLQWERFSAYLADDVTMFFPFAQLPSRRDGREAVEEVFRQFFQSQRSARERAGRPMVQGITPLDLRVQLAGPDAAVASFHLGTEQPSRRSIVFRRTADGWKVVHWHASPAPAPPPASTPAPAAAPAPAPAAAAEVPLSAAERARYVGSYELGSQVPLRVRIFEQDGRLFGQAAGQDAMPLRHVGDHTFESPNSRVVFTVEGGRATGFTLHQGSLTVAARRVD